MVPDGALDEAGLARAVWELARPRGLAVLYVGVCQDAAGEAWVRRRLARLAALTRDEPVRVTTRLAPGAQWAAAARASLRPGDEAVLAAPLRPGRAGRRMGAALAADRRLVVHVLEGLRPAPMVVGAWQQSLGYLAGMGLIVVAFFWAQARLSQLPAGGEQTALLALAVALEFAAMALWHWRR
jgi:hypothetical protein